ncbi:MULTISPECIES: hypothetical protein [unclassified Caldicellulosiruptor]|uniref:hypothetical protein n=1 Tax=unclassified Caldicellulosiruptor TaxID=2622462 RepID=UPI0003A2F105|nr:MULTISPECIES: hypothetical protein [unclassified Caldicellulosiruptor]
MFEIPVYDLSEMLNNYHKITYNHYNFFANKDMLSFHPIYQSCNNILFVMEKNDILGSIIESIIVLSFKNGKVEQTISYKLKNKISQIIFFDEEKFTLTGYTITSTSTKVSEIRIFSVDLAKKEESLLFSFIMEFSEENENKDMLIPSTTHVLALNERYIMLINNCENFKDKFVLIIDLYNKSEFYLDAFITDNHYICEISFAEIKKFKNRNYLFIKTGRISSDEKRYYFNLGEDIINKIETLLIIPCEELIQDLISGVMPALSKYIIDKVEYSETLSFLNYGKPNYGFFYSIKSHSLYIDSPFIPYVKENFLTKRTDIFTYNLETKKRAFIGSLPFPSEKIRPVYIEENRYFLLYRPFHTYLLPIKNFFIKHYIGTNEISFFELPINIPYKEQIEEFYLLKNCSIFVTVNPEEKYTYIYLNDNELIRKISYMEEFFSLIVNSETEELNAIIIYPRFLIKHDS